MKIQQAQAYAPKIQEPIAKRGRLAPQLLHAAEAVASGNASAILHVALDAAAPAPLQEKAKQALPSGIKRKKPEWAGLPTAPSMFGAA